MYKKKLFITKEKKLGKKKFTHKKLFLFITILFHTQFFPPKTFSHTIFSTQNLFHKKNFFLPKTVFTKHFFTNNNNFFPPKKIVQQIFVKH